LTSLLTDFFDNVSKMKLTQDEVQRVATLARLRLTPDEQSRLTDQLDKILEYMAKLNELDTTRVEPIAHVVDIVNALREDQVTSQPNADALLANAPAREDNFFRVPKIIE
jgi:aspartyl-tRNA(Asn)/glutamyl-tRNA(Gln) amidotransferase subunit C